MARENTMYFSVIDRVTPAIDSMRQSGQHFNKDLDLLQGTLENFKTKQSELIQELARYRTEIDEGNKALREARKAYNELGDEISKNKLEEAHTKVHELQEGYKGVTAEINRTRKASQDLLDDQSRWSSRAGEDLLGVLGKAGLYNMVGGAAAGLADFAIGSSRGSTVGGAISSMIEGAISGGVMGTMATGTPGIGTAIGAGVGALSGGLSAFTSQMETEDQYFMEERNEILHNIQEDYASRTGQGISLASYYEDSSIAYGTLFGSEEKAEEVLQALLEMGDDTPYDFDELVALTKVLSTYQYLPDAEGHMNLFQQLHTVGDAGAALGIDSQGQAMVSKNLGMMNMSDRVTNQHIQQLLGHGIPAFEYLEEYYQKSTGEITEMVRKGEISGREASQVISEGMSLQFGGMMDALSGTYSGMLSELEDAEDSLARSRGFGFTETRKEGIQEEIDFLDSEAGQILAESEYHIGMWEAHLKNTESRMERDVLQAVVQGDISEEMLGQFNPETLTRVATLNQEYQTALAEENGVEQGRITQEAKAIAAAEFNASEGAQLQAESERLLVQNTTEMLRADETYYNAGYLLGKEYERGMMDAIDYRSILAMPHIGDGGMSTNADDFGTTRWKAGTRSWLDGSHASGLSYVPYDGYVAEVHRGERITTASEARQQDAAKAGNLSGGTGVTIEKVEIYNGTDIEEFARLLIEAIHHQG